MAKRTNESLSIKEKGTRLLATGLVALGALGLAGCSEDAGAKPAPTVTQSTESPAPAPSETVTPTPSETATPEVPVSKVDKIREWNISPELEGKIEKLGRMIQGLEEGDVDIVRTDVCTEFFAANPLEGFGPASPSDTHADVEARFEAKQNMLLDWISDKFRDDQWRKDVSASTMLRGVESCITNGVTVVGSRTEDYSDAIINDDPVPKVTTRLDWAPQVAGTGENRWVTVTAAVEGSTVIEEPRHRLFGWDQMTKDWNLLAEQVESPGANGWNITGGSR